MPAALLELINSSMPLINRTVDLTLSRQSADGRVYEDGYPDPVLDPFMPIMSYPDPVLALLKLQRFAPTIARIIATDSDAPNERAKLTISQELMGNLKLAKARLLTEEDANILERARLLELGGSAQAAQEIRNVYLQSPALLTQGVINLSTMLALRVATLGKCLYTDPLTNIPAELDYTAQIPSAHLPAAKTGNGRWNQFATADGIADLVALCNAYYTTLRRFPPFIVMSRRTALDLVSQNSVREMWARQTLGIVDSSAVDSTAMTRLPQPTVSDVSEIVSRRLMNTGGNGGATQIVVSDAVFYQQDSTGTVTTASPFIPDGYVFAAVPGFIERAFVPTAENNFGGGLVTIAEEVSRFPMRSRLAVVGRGLPLVPDPRLIAAQNVYDTAIVA